MRGRNSFWGEHQYISKRQEELSFQMISYRRRNNISQKEMARICTLFGAPYNVKFHPVEISNYECRKCAPRRAKYTVLCKLLNIKFEEEMN